MKAIIFDLDNTLSAAKEVGSNFFDPVFSAMREANDGNISEETLSQAFAEIWQSAFDAVARKYHLPEKVAKAGWEEYAKLEVKKQMLGYPDLHLVKELPAQRFLVTSGFRKLQQSKLDALGIESWFDAVYIDAADEPGRKGKIAIFEEIMRDFKLNKSDVIVVGDNPESEIEAGHRLGLQTIQILRPGISQEICAEYVIRSLPELTPIIEGQ